MTGYIIRRILLLVPTLLAVYTVTFFLFRLTPGGPWDKERPVPRQVQEYLDRKYGLDRPLWEQYTSYLVGLVTRFDLGPSYRQTSRTVNDIIADFFPVSARLGLMATAIAVVVGLPLGVLSALWSRSWLDRTAMLVAVVGMSVPSFVVGPLLIWAFALGLRWLPTGGFDRPEQWIMPSVTMALGPTAIFARYTRAAVLEVLSADYIRTARAKGLQERLVVLRHTLRNAMAPVVTVGGLVLASLITGSFFIESIFNVPGIGRYFVSSVSSRDYPVLMGLTLLFATVLAVMNLLVDIAYAYLDPRIRYR